MDHLRRSSESPPAGPSEPREPSSAYDVGQRNGPINAVLGHPPVAAASTGIYTGATHGRVDRWLGIEKYNATVWGESCTETEDCLHLNVFRPARAGSEQARYERLPVIVFIYGGSFQTGSAQSYDPRELVLHSKMIGKPVVFVTFDYRLGALGFLADPALAATRALNLGIQDQRAALEWIHHNIAPFGGDPDMITLWGQSAGAISVGAQMSFNKGIAPLFHRAILSSGALGTIGAFRRTSAWPAKKRLSKREVFDGILGFLGWKNNQNKLDFLRSVPYQDIMRAQDEIVGRQNGLHWGPVEDPDFIPTSASRIYQSGALADMPVMVGTVWDEGSFFISRSRYVSTPIKSKSTLEAYLSDLFPKAKPGNLERLIKYYDVIPTSEWPNTTNETRTQYDRLCALFGDVAFEAPRRKLLDTLVAHGQGKVWSYSFRQPTGLDPHLGVTHGSDLAYWFGHATPPRGSAEERLMHAMMDSLVNFAHNGDPNGDSVPHWPAYDEESRETMQLKADAMHAVRDTEREDAIEYINARPTLFGE